MRGATGMPGTLAGDHNLFSHERQDDGEEAQVKNFDLNSSRDQSLMQHHLNHVKMSIEELESSTRNMYNELLNFMNISNFNFSCKPYYYSDCNRILITMTNNTIVIVAVEEDDEEEIN